MFYMIKIKPMHVHAVHIVHGYSSFSLPIRMEIIANHRSKYLFALQKFFQNEHAIFIHHLAIYSCIVCNSLQKVIHFMFVLRYRSSFLLFNVFLRSHAPMTSSVEVSYFCRRMKLFEAFDVNRKREDW